MALKISRDNLELAANQLWSGLRPKISYLPKDDQELVELAFWQMVQAHGEQRRKSGEFYIVHPVAACHILAKIGLDKDTLAACLLHDVPEDTGMSLKNLSKIFSNEIVFLINGVTKLSVIKYKGEDRYAENLRRMFVAMSQDLRVIFIKLADRLHNLHTLKYLPPDKAKRIAMESIEIYAPIAERLGIGYLRGEIEDAAFPYVYPEDYKRFISISDLAISKREKQLEKIKKKVVQILSREGINKYNIHGRAKRYFSLFKKLREKQTLDQIFDLVALRIVTQSLDECYQILSILNSHFEPIPGRIKDYIAHPKPNGYQSLHTTVTDPTLSVTFEFQIRTQEMHEYAEFGVAAHWAYKSKGQKTDKFLNPENLKWISELVDLGKEKLSEQEYLKMVKLDLFQDRIFVMTPKGDVIDLPEGATALDFAYKIHQQIGYHAVMAKVNGYPIKLSDQLKNGDVVEILTDKKQKPKPDWIHWVKSIYASKRIRIDLRKMQAEK
jgi:GTP pyrophosphokinase